MALPLPFERPVATPTEINRLVKRLIEDGTGELWVKGEISNFTRAASGHLYFSLKDPQSQLRTVMWRGNAMRLRFQPADGVEVEVRGRLSVYEPRGEYQLIAAEMSPAGLGALYVALEALRKKLATEGLFDPGRKRPLPSHPATIGLVTSPSGAAVRDLIRVARSRWPGIGLVLAPTRVQGEGAAAEIVAAIRLMNAWGGADVLIVGRGGGSIEDLWAFNEEPVVRAVAESRIPTVSAVGHEVDFTLCDLAADLRAATPSNAAELVVPDARDLLLRVDRLGSGLRRGMVRYLADRRRRVEVITTTYGFRRPKDFLAQQAQRIDDLARRLALGTTRRLEVQRSRLNEMARRLPAAATQNLAARRADVARLDGQLRSLDPTAVLTRGYCIVQRPDSDAVIRRAADLAVGEPVRLRFSRDRAGARVESAAEPLDEG